MGARSARWREAPDGWVTVATSAYIPAAEAGGRNTFPRPSWGGSGS
jgi:hypothetical protein